MDRGFVFNLINDYISGFSPKDPKVSSKDIIVVAIGHLSMKSKLTVLVSFGGFRKVLLICNFEHC